MDATRQAQIQAHKVFDQVWKRKLVKRRCDAYTWMRQAMILSRSKARISHFTADQCEKLIGLVYRDFPQLRTRYSALLYDQFDESV